MTDYYVAFPEWDWKQLEAEGHARQANHHPSDRDSIRTRDDNGYEHAVGVIGEEAFSYISGLPRDKTMRRGGDALIDFRFGLLTYDVKARAIEHYSMLVKQSQLKTINHYYVHCWVDERRRLVRFWGWVAGVDVAKYPLREARNITLPFKNYEITPRQSAERNIEDLLASIPSRR